MTRTSSASTVLATVASLLLVGVLWAATLAPAPQTRVATASPVALATLA